MADLDPIVAATKARISAGLREHESRRPRYDNSYNVYVAAEPKGVKQAPWRSKLRVKYGMQVIDTALVNIVSGKPRVIVQPRRPEHELAAKAMQAALDYYVGEDHLVEKQPVFVQQGLIYGVTAAKNHWLYRESNRKVKMFGPNGELVGVENAPIVDRDGPTFEPWNIYHCYWEPGARDVDSAGYVVLQSYVSKDDLLRLKYNDETKQGLYHNVDELLAAGESPQPYTSAQASALGIGADRYEGKFLIEEVWTDDKLVVIGNGQILLRAQENPYWHGRKPVVIAQTRPDLFEMVGIPETDLVDHLQQALHTVQNMRMDQQHLTVARGITYREGGVTDPNALEIKPGFKWPVSDHDDIQPFQVQPLPPEAYTEEQALLSHLQLVTGINPYVSGSDTQGVDQNTATGITALQEVASRLLRFKAAQIQYKGYQRTYEQWGDMIQQFLDHDIAVKLVGAGGNEAWLNVSPQDVIGHLTYTLEGSEESLSRQQERGEAIALFNALAPLIQAGIINPKPLAERIAVAYDFPNPEALLAAPPQAAPPAAPYAPQQPTGGTNPQQLSLLGGQTMNPNIQNAILQGR